MVPIVDRGDEAIPLSRQRLYIARGGRIIAQCRSDLADAQIDTVFKVNESFFTPKLPLQVFTRDKLSRTGRKYPQDFGRLRA